ncbi:MAG TPA: DUF2523 domain-containing protein [Burkholderiaceae bacterium]|nr:DUF2523 domain-containing protein [Burkholderiaceae bacterium]
MGWNLLIGWLIGGLAQATASLVGRALLALGIGYVTYSGLNVGIDAIYSSVRSSFGGLPSDVASLMAYLWVDKAISTVFSAFAAALAVKMAGRASITKMVVKK